MGACGRRQTIDLGDSRFDVLGDSKCNDDVQAPRRTEIAQRPDVNRVFSGDSVPACRPAKAGRYSQSADHESFLVQQRAVAGSQLHAPFAPALGIDRIPAVRAVALGRIRQDTELRRLNQPIASIPSMQHRRIHWRLDAGKENERSRADGISRRRALPVAAG